MTNDYYVTQNGNNAVMLSPIRVHRFLFILDPHINKNRCFDACLCDDCLCCSYGDLFNVFLIAILFKKNLKNGPS